MLATERHAQVLQMLRSARTVRTEEVAERLNVSTETVRRDLKALELAGALQRVHGGARSVVLAPVGDEAPFLERSRTAGEAKERIGQAASALIRPGQTIVIDVGTTALQVARALPIDFTGVVATCSLLAAVELADRPGVEVLVSGGRMRSGDLALSNSQTVEFFLNLHADIAFLGSGGVDADAGLTDYYLEEAASRRAIIRNATESFVLADATKFGRVARHRVAKLTEITGLVTDEQPPAAIVEAASGARILVAD